MDQGNRTPNNDETVRISPNNLPPFQPAVPPAVMTCPNCRGQIPTGSAFCGFCGMPFAQPQQPASPVPQPVVIYPVGYNPQPEVKKATSPLIYILAAVGGLSLLVIIALMINSFLGAPAVSSANPTATADTSTQAVTYFQTAVAATATAAGQATEPVKPLPTATFVVIQPPTDPSPEELAAWFTEAIAGSPENYQMILDPNGVIGAPGFTGCESGDCFPTFSVDETVALIQDAKLNTSFEPTCLSYVSYENQVLINFSNLAFNRNNFLPEYYDDFGAYQFAFYRETADQPYRLNVIIGIQESMLDSIQAGANDYLACP